MSRPKPRADDPELNGWRAERFGFDVRATERVTPYGGEKRLRWYVTKREGERVRALLTAGLT